MEQTTQQITQKSSLPIKTKIAAWLIIVISILLFIGTTMIYFGGAEFGQGIRIFFLPLIIFLILPILLISFRKKLVWWCIVVLLILSSILIISSLIFTVIPLILLILDRKNFFKIAS
jgi:hypothetical protein